MAADAAEYGYTAIERKADSGEHRQHSDVDTFREMAARREELDKTAQKLEEVKRKLDKQGKAQQTFERYIKTIISDLDGSKAEYATYAEMMTALSAAKDKFMETTITEAKQKAQEAAEADFQKQEDALEAQKVVLADLQELKDRLEKIADTDTSRKRFMLSHKLKDGRTLEDAYQQTIQQRQERTEALLEKGIELTAKFEEMQSQDSQQEYH